MVKFALELCERIKFARELCERFEEEIGSKRRAASHFFELEADVDSGEEGEDEEEEAEEGFIDDDSNEIDNSVLQRRHVIHPQIGEDEDEFTRRIVERYGRKSRYEEEENATEVLEFQQALLPTIKDSKLWMVKCAIGHEREVGACLMQKQIDKSFKLQIKSVIALDHLQNYIYVEADKESHVRDACKGMRNIFLKNKIVMVPNKEMSDVLTVKNRESEFSNDSWVRLKTGNYKGDLAQVVNVDDIRRRVTVKLIPRIDFQALVNKIEGNLPLEKSKKFCPPPRYWSASKAKALEIPVKRQRDLVTGDYFDTVNGMKFKDGFLYKPVSIRSISNNVQPTPDDLEKFRGARDDDNDTENSIGLPESVAIHSKDLIKIFELGDHVKVVSGSKEGEIGSITSVKGHVVTVLPDKSTNTLDVLADHIQKSSEVAYCTKDNNRSRNGVVTITNFRPPPLKKREGFGRVRRDPLLNARIKIRQGPYNGMTGTVVEVRGNKTRVELEAQMNFVYVDRDQIYENVETENSSCMEERYGRGGETPMYCPRTPLRPWMTPTRDSPATPIHERMRTPMRSRAWNP
ncbi:putative transcription elongation factor SPT5 homolog 1 [Lycium barbarum]|uniref:putative transcription elongation factor SPT5 homolog 1 n=1 Tax=Lycium barbarum TaxID=112863 RepID=UPI00293E24C8|nr:putative transcription elongation factor SPT5 homolog 1 [Lycium barbarum]